MLPDGITYGSKSAHRTVKIKSTDKKSEAPACNHVPLRSFRWAVT